MHEYKKVRNIEYVNGHGIQLMVALPEERKFSFEEKQAFSKAVNAIDNAIQLEDARQAEFENPQRPARRAEVAALFECPIYIEEIPNQYCDRPCCSQIPWYVITTPVGRITVGHRKRVWEIDWKQLPNPVSHLFVFPPDFPMPHENTRDDYYVHAWSLEYAKDYIRQIIRVHQDRSR